MLLTETHCHTMEVSLCAKVPAREIPSLYHNAGYGAIVVTDHYNTWTLDALAGDRKTQISLWLRGYRSVQEAGESIGMKVFLGMELALADAPADYLIYGIDEPFLYRHPRLAECRLHEVSALVKREGLLLYQAHPCRMGIRRAPAKHLHGVEVYNGNPRHDSHNERALAFAEKHALKKIAGSDFHQHEDVGRAGVFLPDGIDDNRQLVACLAGNEARLFTATFPSP